MQVDHILPYTPQQKEIARKPMEDLEKSKLFKDKEVTTEIIFNTYSLQSRSVHQKFCKRKKERALGTCDIYKKFH
jgi:peptide methionine sulfoxide reductase MsrA